MQFKLGRQEDAHEFLRYLVEGMQDHETGKLPKEQRDENEKKIKLTRTFGVFGGLMKTVVECLGCHHKSITPERYYDFNIVHASRIRSANEPALSMRAWTTSLLSTNLKAATNIFVSIVKIDQMPANDIFSTLCRKSLPSSSKDSQIVWEK